MAIVLTAEEQQSAKDVVLKAGTLYYIPAYCVPCSPLREAKEPLATATAAKLLSAEERQLIGDNGLGETTSVKVVGCILNDRECYLPLNTAEQYTTLPTA